MSHITKAKSTIGHMKYVRQALEENNFDFVMTDREDIFEGSYQSISDVDIYISSYTDKNGTKFTTHFGLKIDEDTRDLEIIGDFYLSGFDNAEEFRKFLLKEVWKEVLKDKFPNADIIVNEEPEDIEIDETNEDIIEFELIID